MRAYMLFIAILGWFALLLQFYLIIAVSYARASSILEAVTNYFSFFTILSNILVALGLTCRLAAPDSSSGRFFARTSVASGIAVYIIVVGGVYSLVLRQLWNPEGLQKLADILLHDIVPVLYATYWLIFVARTPLSWKSIIYWLIYPLAYLFYTLIRGAFSNWYPYPFVNAQEIGYHRVLFNSMLVLGGFLVVSVVVVGLGKFLRARLPFPLQPFS